MATGAMGAQKHQQGNPRHDTHLAAAGLLILQCKRDLNGDEEQWKTKAPQQVALRIANLESTVLSSRTWSFALIIT